MKILPALLTHCLIALLCFSLSACSSHNKKSALNHTGATAAADSQDEEISSAEPEETALEELEALNKPGAWELGVSKTYSLEKMGIDPSRYDFPISVNNQVLYYLELFQGKQRNYFSQWLARSTVYRPYIEAELKKAGLPLDLAYLAMIESGYNPSAYSPAKASGLWQFMEGTGITYGLRIDQWVDERRDPEKATKAATRYLARLHTQFGDWYLAVAAYNAGEGRVDSAMKKCAAKNFWEVAISEGIFMETKRYVPKLIAAIIIARNPEKYGFNDISFKKPQGYETITLPGGVSLEAVAATANTSVKELRTLNNELRKNQTPPKHDYALRLPVGTKELVASNLSKLRPVTTVTFATHTVQKGETLDAILTMYHINKTTLLKANNLRTAQLMPGLRLKIPTSATKYVLPKERQQPEESLAKTDNKGKLRREIVLHTLKTGETLDTLAKQYQVPVQSIMQWNKISRQSQVKKGQQIALHFDRSAQESFPVTENNSKAVAKIAADIKQTVHLPVPDATKKINGTKPLTEAAPKQPVAVAVEKERAKIAADIKQTAQVPTLNTTKKINGAKTPPEPAPKQAVVATVEKERPPTWYVVQNGDTLANIARKFQATTQNIRDWNKLSNNTLQTGNKLIVKKG